jgi:hypothetical protein
MNHNCGTLVTTAWHILGLWMEKTASRYADMLSKQLQRAQAVSRRLPIAASRVRAQVRSCGVCGQSGTGAGFLRVLRFPLPILIPQMLHTHLSSRAGTTVQLVADVPSGVSLTPTQETEKENYRHRNRNYVACYEVIHS